MFDWDRDYETVVEDPHPVGAAAEALLANPARGSARWRRIVARLGNVAGRLAMTAAVALGLAAGGVALTGPQGATAQLVVALAEWPVQVLRLGAGTLPAALPEGLVAYEQPEYDNFRRGIARFSDADLLHYVRNAELDMATDTPIADFTRDALYLAQREIDRRGLQRPVASLRDTFKRS